MASVGKSLYHGYQGKEKRILLDGCWGHSVHENTSKDGSSGPIEKEEENYAGSKLFGLRLLSITLRTQVEVFGWDISLRVTSRRRLTTVCMWLREENLRRNPSRGDLDEMEEMVRGNMANLSNVGHQVYKENVVSGLSYEGQMELGFDMEDNPLGLRIEPKRGGKLALTKPAWIGPKKGWQIGFN
ncbi:hypothetical protein GOBAR_AA00884 [Gossypium barbadense]|uniref:Uncharacterized protein n=1 Tax=Gossypium barbadense TaxID=3634 RepID=A0A2P5YVS4_GOSBA|nr:hypothetical protein GOBAR_AA00884 [Gossypium barbadense]